MNKKREQSTVTDEDRAALERSAEAVRLGRFATDDAVQKIFDRVRRAQNSDTQI